MAEPPSAGSGGRHNPGRSRDHFRWDEHHHQPHTDLSKWRKMWMGRSDLASHVAVVGRGLRHAWPVVRAYRRLLAAPAEPQPVAPAALGVAISPTAATLARYVDVVAELGARSLLLRVPSWDPDPVFALGDQLARLHAQGFTFAFALLQDRAAVTDPGRWQAFVADAAACFEGLEPVMQIGHAVNRKKWGVWHPTEYLRMLEAVPPVRERHPSCRFIGPPVIDFEYYFTLGFLATPRACDFDGVASLLYVDRRGSPDQRQYRHFDLRRKLLLLRAVVEASPHPTVPIYLTEFNWPLRGAGRHSPAGPKVETDEISQAGYLALYYLTVLASGGIEAAYWWQLVARGYGLCDDDEQWRRRAAFRAFRQLARATAGGRVERLECSATAAGFLIEREELTTVVAYDARGETHLDLAGVSVTAEDVEGRELRNGELTRLTPVPLYLHCDAADVERVLAALALRRAAARAGR